MPPEDTGAGSPPAGAPAQPQAGTTAGGQEPPAATGQAPAAGTQSGTDPKAGTTGDTEPAEAKAARLEREIAELRREAASYRTKATTLEREAAAAAEKDMTEAQKAAKRTTELEQMNAKLAAQLQDQGVRGAALEAATKLGYRSPDLAARLLARDEIEFDEATGRPKNVERLLREELARHPELGKGAGADYGGGNRGATPGAQPDMNELLRTAFGKG